LAVRYRLVTVDESFTCYIGVTNADFDVYLHFFGNRSNWATARLNVLAIEPALYHMCLSKGLANAGVNE
jgi:hypothetical protein